MSTEALKESNEVQLLSPEIEEQCLTYLSKNMWGMLCELLKTNESEQEAIVKFMDNLLDGEYEVNILRRHPNLHFKDTRNVIKKWLRKILKMYKFPKGICPNLLSSHRMGFISHTFHQYQRKHTTYHNWKELVLYAAKDCKQTQRRVVNMLRHIELVKLAAELAHQFQFEEDEFTKEMLQERQKFSKDPNYFVGEVRWSLSDEYDKGVDEYLNNPFHTFHFPRPPIKLLSVKEEFFDCLANLSQPDSVVGVDTEWQMLFDTESDKECVALIQLATADIIYILDVINLIKHLSSDDWMHFFHHVFCNESVTKLGYGLSQDFKVLKHTFPFINFEDFVNIIDLQITMDRKNSSQQGISKKRQTKGLSGLTEDYLYKPLDKSYQISCWSKRPLSKRQVLYAALDAYVLLQLYEIALLNGINLSPEKLDLGSSFTTSDEILQNDESLNPESSECDKKRSGFALECCSSSSPPCNINHPSSPSSSQCSVPLPAISPHSLRVIVDTMLQGLGWSLRSVGVDTLILKNGQNHKDAIALAIRENRVVLTSGKVYQMFCARLGENKCYHVANNKAKKQLQDVLGHFNVRVQKQDILSRCQLCNCKTFVSIESEKMRLLKESQSQQQGCSATSGEAWSSNPNGFQIPEFLPDPDISVCQLMPMLEDLGAKSEPMLEATNHFINMKTAVFQETGIAIQMDYIPDAVFEENKIFYCCVNCGKVYWDGCHHDRVINQLNGLIPLYNDNEEDSSIYDILKTNAEPFRSTQSQIN